MFQVKADGKLIEMENIKLSDSIEQFVAQYEIAFFDENLFNYFLSHPNTKIEIFFDGKKIKTCYVDQVEEDKSLEGRTMTIRGRGSLCDLIDSSVYYPGFIRKITYLGLIDKMIKPFGISVVDNVGLNPTLEKLQFDNEETAFEAINKYAKNFNVILDEDKDGNLVINKPSELVRGRYTESDFSSVQYRKDYSGLYSIYLAVTDGDAPQTATVKDKTLRLRLKTKEVDITDDVKKVARYLRDVRKTQSETISINNIKGFRFQDGSIIETNSLIRFTTARLDSTYRVTGFSTEQDSEGITTSLTIKRKDSYDLESEEDVLKGD